MPNYNPKIENLVPFTGKDDPRRANGREKGTKNLKTIVRELENEDFNWSKIPIQGKKKNEYLNSIGSPWRAIVIRAMLDAIKGDKDAREWLTKVSYGNKLDSISNERRVLEPIYISKIKPRPVNEVQ